MKKLMTTAAAFTMTAGMVAAEAHMIDLDRDNLIRTRDITGGDIYTLAEGEAMGDSYDMVDTGWNDIGEIEDVILDRSGQMIGIVAEVGGFLDIGDKHVVIPVSNVRLVATDDRTYSYVTDMSEEMLEELPGVDEGFWD